MLIDMALSRIQSGEGAPVHGSRQTLPSSSLNIELRLLKEVVELCRLQ